VKALHVVTDEEDLWITKGMPAEWVILSCGGQYNMVTLGEISGKNNVRIGFPTGGKTRRKVIQQDEAVQLIDQSGLYSYQLAGEKEGALLVLWEACKYIRIEAEKGVKVLGYYTRDGEDDSLAMILAILDPGKSMKAYAQRQEGYARHGWPTFPIHQRERIAAPVLLRNENGKLVVYREIKQ
jgi:hypothetical protein